MVTTGPCAGVTCTRSDTSSATPTVPPTSTVTTAGDTGSATPPSVLVCWYHSLARDRKCMVHEVKYPACNASLGAWSCTTSTTSPAAATASSPASATRTSSAVDVTRSGAVVLPRYPSVKLPPMVVKLPPDATSAVMVTTEPYTAAAGTTTASTTPLSCSGSSMIHSWSASGTTSWM